MYLMECYETKKAVFDNKSFTALIINDNFDVTNDTIIPNLYSFL